MSTIQLKLDLEMLLQMLKSPPEEWNREEKEYFTQLETAVAQDSQGYIIWDRSDF